MRVEPLTNSGVRKIEKELRENLFSCTKFSIASAFLSEEGVGLLSGFVESNKSKERIGRVIVSLYGGFNSKKSLLALLKLARKSNGRILAAISRDTKLHWKFYYFEHRQSITIFNGSANLTQAGIDSGNELHAKITLSGPDKRYGIAFLKEFDKQWSNSQDIVNFPIEKYKESVQFRSRAVLHPEIQRLLAAPRRSSRPRTQEITAVILVRPILSGKAEKLIYEIQSKWEKEGWDIYSVPSKREFDFEGKIGSQMFLIEKDGRLFKFCRIQVMDTTILRTNDGKYFVAYRLIGKKRGGDKKFRQPLKELGADYHARDFSFKHRISKGLAKFIAAIV